MKAYISGGMTNIPEFNFPEFDSVTKAWRQLGREAVSPAEHDREVLWHELQRKPEDVPGYAAGDWSQYEASVGKLGDLLAWDIVQIARECDAIVMLPGWERSSGARIERLVAEVTGKTVYLARRFGDMWTFPVDSLQQRMSLSVLPAFDAAAAEVR